MRRPIGSSVTGESTTDRPPPVRRPGGFDALVRDFPPTYFAATMSLGAAAVGAEQLGLTVLATSLAVLAVVTLVLTSAVLSIRVIRYPRRVVDDLQHHATAFTILTTVAAFNIVGGAAIVVLDRVELGWVCWTIGLVMWPPLLYSSVLSTIIEHPKPPLARGINGTWFLMTVSTQAVVTTTALLLARTGTNQALELLAVAGFGLGIVLYLIVMTLLFLRWVFTESTPDEDDPPSWIAAGAMATTALAGSRILALDTSYQLVDRLAPFIEGLVIVGWATATFWLPLMVAVQVWRHGVHHMPWGFVPSMWSMVFPVATYGAATWAMADQTGLTILRPVPPVFLVLALAGILLVGTGSVRSITSTVRRGS